MSFAFLHSQARILGGAIDATPIGGTTRSTANFTTLDANGATTLDQVTIDTTAGAFAVSGTNGATINPAGAVVVSSTGSTITSVANGAYQITSTTAGITLTTSAASQNISLTTQNTGKVNIPSTLTSTNTTSGALTVAGGVGILENLNVGGNTVITGNLTVNGTTTTVNSTTLTTSDNVIVVNNTPGGVGGDAGLYTRRYQIANDAGTGDVVSDVAFETGSVDAAPAPTSTTISDAGLASAVNDFYNNWYVKITSGAGANEVRLVSDYDGAAKTLTVATPFTNTPSTADTFNLYNRPFVGLIYDESLDEWASVATVTDPAANSAVVIQDYVNFHCASLVASSINVASLILSGSTNSTSKDTGTLILQNGGLGVELDVFIGGSLNVSRVDSEAAETLLIGDSTATKVEIADTGVVTEVQGGLNIEGTLDRIAGGALNIGGATATSVNIGKAAAMTTVLGTLNVDQAVTMDSTLAVDDIDTLTATTLLLGKATATKIEIADSGVVTEVQGALTVEGSVDTIGGSVLLLGAANATKLELADTGVTTEVQGPLTVAVGTGNGLDTLAAGTLYLGEVTATKVEIADTGVITEVQGALNVEGAIDRIAAGTLTLGASTATAVTIASSAVTTTVAGDLLVKSRVDAATATVLVLGNDIATKVEIADAAITTEIQGPVTVEGSLDTITGTTLLVGPANATKVEIADTGVVTEVQGGLTVESTVDTIVAATLALGSVTATAVTLARVGFPTTVLGSFNVDGAATMDTTLAVDDIDSLTATTLLLGKSTATKVEIADTGVTTEVQGPLTVEGSIDRSAGGALNIGGTTATSVNIGKAAAMTTVLGTFNVDQAASFDSSVTITGTLNSLGTVFIADNIICIHEDTAIAGNDSGIFAARFQDENDSGTGDVVAGPVAVTDATVSATSTTLVGSGALSAVDDFYNGWYVKITSGAGSGQVRLVADYVGASKTFTVAAWTTTPSAADTFSLYNRVHVGYIYDESADEFAFVASIDCSGATTIIQDYVDLHVGSLTVEDNLNINGAILTNRVDSTGAFTLQLGDTNATKVEIADSGVETEIQGLLDAMGGITTDDVDTRTATTLVLGGITATKVEIADTGVVTEVQGGLTIEGSFDTIGAVTLALGPANATKVEIADTGVTTEVQGPLTIEGSIDSIGAVTLVLGASNATKVEIADAGITTEVQGPLTVAVGTGNGVDTLAAGTLYLGELTATKVEIADTGVVTEVQGGLNVEGSLDTITAVAFNIGGTTASSVNIGKAGNMTTVLGTLNVDQAVTLDTTLAVDDLDSLTATTLLLGKSTATKIELADTGVLTEVQGTFAVLEGANFDGAVTVQQGSGFGIDVQSAGTLYLGEATATAVNIADTGVTTTVSGPLTVSEAATFTSTVAVNAIDARTATTLDLGSGANTTGVNISAVGETTTIKGNLVVDGSFTLSGLFVDTVENLSGAGGGSVTVTLTKTISFITTTGTGVVTATLPDGTADGQNKRIFLVSQNVGTTFVLSPTASSKFMDANSGAITSLTFLAAGQSINIVWCASVSKWFIVSTGALLA